MVVGGGKLFTRPFLMVLGFQAAYGFAMAAFILLPKSLAEAGGSAAQIGRVMAAFGIASVLTIPLLGRLSAALGRRGVLIVASVGMAASCVGFGIVSDPGPAAVVLRALQGMAWAMTFSAAISLASELAPPARMAQGIGLAGAASLIMNALAPAIGEPLAESIGYRPFYVLAAAAGVGATAFALRLRAGDSDAPPRPVVAVAAAATASRPSPAAVGPSSRVPVYVALGLGALAYTVLFTFLAPFALERGIRAIRTFFVGYTVTALAIRILGGRLFDRLGHRRVGLAALVLYGLVVVAAGVFGPEALLLLGLIFGLAHGAVIPSLMALLLQGAPIERRPQILGIANAAMSLGVAAVFPAGLAANGIGYPALFVVTGVVTAASSVLLGAGRSRPPPTAAGGGVTASRGGSAR